MEKTPKTAQMAKFVESGTSNYEKVAEILQQKNTSATINEIVDTTSLARSTVSRCLTMLRKEGLVVLTNEKKGRQSLYRWIGGVPTLENELLEATNKHVSASLLAETYDALITDAFALFSILLENGNWEVITNLKEGLTDTELHQRVGNDIPLDTIRRILVTCDAHNLIKINRIRESAGTDFVRLFEPLFRVDSVNKSILSDLIMLRGLASAIRFEIDDEPKNGYIHPYAILLKLTRNLYYSLQDTVLSTTDKNEQELFAKIIANVYDFAPDLDRVYRSENWRQKLKYSKNIIIDESSDHLLLTDDFTKKCKVNMIKQVSGNNE
jgi:transcription initiation factor IIE alpha subunit